MLRRLVMPPVIALYGCRNIEHFGYPLVTKEAEDCGNDSRAVLIKRKVRIQETELSVGGLEKVYQRLSTAPGNGIPCRRTASRPAHKGCFNHRFF